MSDQENTSGQSYAAGGDAVAISAVARMHFGDFTRMFEHHGWPERGQDMMRKVQTRVVETYGSVRAFDAHFRGIEKFMKDSKAIWTDDMSVLFTSFWGWTPEDWGTVGWTGDKGRTRRNNLLKTLTDPFICVCYVTSNQTRGDPALKGMIGGFYLVSHETGDRDAFTHPIHHLRNPDKWRHSLRAIRAFSYLPEYRPRAMDMFPDLSRTARTVSAMGEIITDTAKIDQLRGIPFVEVPVFSSRMNPEEIIEDGPFSGMVLPGPDNAGGYEVADRLGGLPRHLYVLRLKGDAAAFLGREPGERSIIKIGLSVSPDLRRQSLQKSMPRGAFVWQVDRTTGMDGHAPYSGHEAAVVGETAMKVHLAQHAEWLGGEFYLASDADIDTAWQAGRHSALNFQSNEVVHDG